MLKEKDRRIVLLVLLGVALVSLITAAVACFVNSLAVLCDFGLMKDLPEDTWYYYMIAYVLLPLGILAVAYFCVKLFVRKTFIPSLVLALAVVCYVIVSIIALRNAPIFKVYSNGEVVERFFDTNEYTFFQTTYVAVSVSVAVAAAVAETSSLLVLRMDRKKAKVEDQLEARTQME